jgi:hypothetical protein
MAVFVHEGALIGIAFSHRPLHVDRYVA